MFGGGKNKAKRKIIINDKEIINAHVTDETIDLKKSYVSAIIKTEKLPIVILDPLWLKAREHIKSKIILKGEKELKELLKERSRLTNDLKEYTVVKQKFMEDILTISSKVQTEEDIKSLDTLDKLHESVLKTNDKIKGVEDRMGQLEIEIEKKNKDIISEMIAIGYSYIDNYKLQNDLIEEEVARLRQKVLDKTNQKKANEYSLKEIYSYLHSIVGRKEVEELDRKLSHYHPKNKK